MSMSVSNMETKDGTEGAGGLEGSIDVAAVDDLQKG